MEQLARIPLMVTEKILTYVTESSDRKNCRLVCYNWVYLIDKFGGMKLKLTRANKAKLFYSDLLRSCTSLKIYESAGLLNWYICPFSRNNLKSVEIRGNILNDNWKLLLRSCEALEFLTFTIHTKIIGKLKPFNFSAQSDMINHYGLRRILFRGIEPLDPNVEALDIVSIVNILDTIGTVPGLRQVVMSYNRVVYNPMDSQHYMFLRRALTTLKARNSSQEISIGMTHQMSSFADMKVWDGYLRNTKNSLIIQIGFLYENWRALFDNVLGENLDTLYYGIYNNIYHNDLGALIRNIRMQSMNLKKVHITISSPTIFNCMMLLGLQNLTELSLYNFNSSFGARSPNPLVINVNALAMNNAKLEYLYLSIPLSHQFFKNNISDIFALQHLKELHIKQQKCTLKLESQHFDLIVKHPNLKFIFWEGAQQKKWQKFGNSSNLAEGWKSMRQRVKQPQKADMFTVNKKLFVLTPNEGHILAKKLSKQYANNFAILNKDRMDEKDWARVRKDYR